MPKAFSEKEREVIYSRLKTEAKHCLSVFGVRKTTVDEIVKRVNIPKGTFYLFYDSKELLLFDVLLEFHEQVNALVQSRLEQLGAQPDVQAVTGLLFDVYQLVQPSFLYSLMTSGELEYLMRRLPPEAAQKHSHTDDLNLEQLLAFFPHKSSIDTKVFSAALRAVFMTAMFKHEIGHDQFDGALWLMLRGVVMQMMGEQET